MYPNLKTTRAVPPSFFGFASDMILISASIMLYLGFPDGSALKNLPANSGDLGPIPGSGRSPWRREWQPTPVFLPGEFHGQRSLVATVHGVAKSRIQLSD